ncbi:MAG TPA: SDR family oxidoreductase [Galbitalea sp.]|jgi:putative NADH-flavin reductase|nr:SDR family oxidoreductase [Galbitalea sp.]
MNIAVFGANGGTGRLLVAAALDAGHDVTALTRHPDEFPVRHDRLRVVAGDVLDPVAVATVVAGGDTVLSTLGVPYGRKEITLYSQSIGVIIDAMERSSVTRLACVSSSATDPEFARRDTGGGFFFERVLKPVIENTMGKTLYADMRRMERLVRASELDWTIIRPSGLFTTDAVTAYATAEDFLPQRFTSRADLADFLLRQATETGFVRKAAAVATLSPQPTVLELMRNEALAK